jgi:hypothetical protein
MSSVFVRLDKKGRATLPEYVRAALGVAAWTSRRPGRSHTGQGKENKNRLEGKERKERAGMGARVCSTAPRRETQLPFEEKPPPPTLRWCRSPSAAAA